jgi:hypothetical protein
VGRSKTACMLNRTPVLFGTGGDFGDICAQAIGVRTVDTIEAFNEIQVSEVTAIKYQLV